MTNAQLNIIAKAIKIRLANGESIKDILASYTKLTEEDIAYLQTVLSPTETK